MQLISQDVLVEKYFKGNETTHSQLYHRVAESLAKNEIECERYTVLFTRALESGFIPAGRIMSACGTDIQATLINCFVQPVGDAISVEDHNGFPGIYQALHQSAESMRRGGGVGYDFSRLRPKGALVKGTASSASGPVSYMRIFDKSCETLESAGARRGAQMGSLRCDHPDIESFIHAKDKAGELTNFNISVGITNEFMEAVKNDLPWELIHEAEPSADQDGVYQRNDGKWVYKVIQSRDLWNQIMVSTYDHAEPGVLFIDNINHNNNLNYIEVIETSNPCGEQPLPPHGCCCLGSINLTRFIHSPFTEKAAFAWDTLREMVPIAIRMLDNVLDTTYWPLPQQREEAMNKRRIGLGITGLGDALIMLGLKYDTKEAREMASDICREIRDQAYLASVLLAKEKGSFPLFNEKYLDSPFIQRLPKELQSYIKEYGIRNSHLLSIAPTGTISLAFADNASNGIEPPFSWTYTRTKRMKDGTKQEYQVEDHAYRLYKQYGGDVNNLPDYWITALEISATDHAAMLSAVQPYIDSSISKTVNCPSDYPFEDFKNLYFWAWENGLKGLATFRPNNITGSVLSVANDTPLIQHLDLHWVKRPRPEEGNPSWTYMVDKQYAVFIGEIDKEPFEVWINGVEQPRGLGALAKSLSMDMRTNNRGYVLAKLKRLLRCHDKDVSTLSKLILKRWCELGTLPDSETVPILHKEMKTLGNGSHCWTMDIDNAATGDQLTLLCKEGKWQDGKVRPYALWLAGEYPKSLDGLCKSLSIDMRVLDIQWILSKLIQLSDYPEPRGDFMAWIPGEKKKANYPSTVAYITQALLYRYEILGFNSPVERNIKTCPECKLTLYRTDGCYKCNQCGYIGDCG